MALRAESYGQEQEAVGSLWELEFGSGAVSSRGGGAGAGFGARNEPMVESFCYARCAFGCAAFRVTISGQLRTGTDKGNPTV